MAKKKVREKKNNLNVNAFKPNLKENKLLVCTCVVEKV